MKPHQGGSESLVVGGKSLVWGGVPQEDFLFNQVHISLSNGIYPTFKIILVRTQKVLSQSQLIFLSILVFLCEYSTRYFTPRRIHNM